jgi:tetratricopeptide (TPR) repeat protein
MKSVYEQCARLIPPASERKRDKYKMAFYLFWNREKVEKLLLELRDHVDRYSHDFHVGALIHAQFVDVLIRIIRQLRSSLRTEAHVVNMRETVIQSTSQGFSGVYSHSGLGTTTNMSSNVLGHVSNSQIIAFTQSTSMSITWIPDSVPTRDLSDAYLRRVLGSVHHSLRSILTCWSQNLPTNMELSNPESTWNLEELPVSRNVMHEDAVAEALYFQSLLRDNLSNSWFDHVDRAITELFFKLNDLDMYEDAVVLCALRVDLWRVIVKQHPSQTSSLGLIHALDVLAATSSCMGNQRQAYARSEEAIKILQSLSAAPAILPLKKDELMRMARLMLIRALNSDESLQVQLAVDARRILEHNMGITDFQSGTDVSSASNWVSQSVNNQISDDDWFTYAASLSNMAGISSSESSKSRELAELALEILNHLLAKYPGSNRIITQLLFPLEYLMHATDPRAVSTNLKYVEQYVSLLRQLAPFDAQRYVLRLARALWSHRKALVTLGRSAEAESIYQDIISLKALAAAPSHSDLQIPSETEGDYYAQLAQCHYDAERFTDAVYAAQNAISQYIALEFTHPGQSRAKHMSALALLCMSFSAANQHDGVISEGFKFIKMFDNSNIYGSDSDLVKSYQDVLCLVMEALGASAHLGALSQVEDIKTRIRKFAYSRKIYTLPLVKALKTYIDLLWKNVGEVTEHLQDARRDWEELFRESASNTECCSYHQYLMGLINAFERKKETDKALHYIEEAITFWTKRFLDNRAFENKHSPLQSLKLKRILLFCDAGRHPEALELSQTMVADIRKDSQTTLNIVNAVATARALTTLALMQLYNGMPADAIATATEALNLDQNLKYTCLLTLSRGLHDIDMVEEALTHLDEAEKAEQKKEYFNPLEELEATDRSEYKTLLFERSKILFTKGDYLEAVKLIRKVEAIQREDSKGNDLSALEHFATMLSYSRILYCSLGQHEEGLAAAVELAKIKEYIRMTSPTFAHAMDIKFTYLKKRGSWKAVQDAKDGLTCTHQDNP